MRAWNSPAVCSPANASGPVGASMFEGNKRVLPALDGLALAKLKPPSFNP
jgi:hypothetical protein